MKLTLDGKIAFSADAGRYWIAHNAPLYLNVLHGAGGLLAMPTDQSGGIRAGDRHSVSIQVDEGAQVDWRPAQSTLVMPAARGEQNEAARIENEIQVGRGRLYYHAPPTIPFAAAALVQKTRIACRSESQFLFWEWFSAGRVASGEKWQFQSLELELEFQIDDSVVYREHCFLSKARIPAGPAGWREANRWLSGLALSPTAGLELQKLAAAARLAGAIIEVGRLESDCWIARGYMPP